MAKVDLTLGESKTKVDLTLDQKKTTQTWADTGTETWGGATRTYAQPGEFSTREQKTKVDLTLETK